MGNNRAQYVDVLILIQSTLFKEIHGVSRGEEGMRTTGERWMERYRWRSISVCFSGTILMYIFLMKTA